MADGRPGLEAGTEVNWHCWHGMDGGMRFTIEVFGNMHRRRMQDRKCSVKEEEVQQKGLQSRTTIPSFAAARDQRKFLRAIFPRPSFTPLCVCRCCVLYSPVAMAVQFRPGINTAQYWSQDSQLEPIGCWDVWSISVLPYYNRSALYSPLPPFFTDGLTAAV